jgi:hypothetical protein
VLVVDVPPDPTVNVALTRFADDGIATVKYVVVDVNGPVNVGPL